MQQNLKQANTKTRNNKNNFKAKFIKLKAEMEALKKSLRSIRQEKINVEKRQSIEDAIILHLGEGMIVISTTGKITLINSFAKELLGFNVKTQLHGKHFNKVFTLVNANGNALCDENNPIDRIFKTQHKVSVGFQDDIYCKRQNGDQFPIMLSSTPIIISGSMKGVTVIFHDIGKEKRFDEVKKDFISIASHQLRTPLTVTTLHTDMLLAGHGGKLSNEQSEYLREIQHYNSKMKNLLSVFLEASKIELDTFATDMKTFSLEPVIEDVLGQLLPDINRKRITIKSSVKSNIVSYADPHFIRIALLNIINNAVRYTPEKGNVDISAIANKTNIVISIQDDGYGIPEDEKPRIFSKLYRGSNVKTRDWEGSGLGLYIARSIIKKANGDIWFKSSENVGTTFFLELPINS